MCRNWKYLATHDSLCGCYNRTWLELNRKKFEKNYNLCVVIVDINNLKETNDLKGHFEGDNRIYFVCSLLSCCDNLGIVRLGGDEFMMILKDVQCENFIDIFLEQDEFSYGLCKILDVGSLTKAMKCADYNMLEMKRSKHCERI